MSLPFADLQTGWQRFEERLDEIDRPPLYCFRSGMFLDAGCAVASAHPSAPAAQRSYPTVTFITGGTGFWGWSNEVHGIAIVNVLSSLMALDAIRSGHVDIRVNEIDPRTHQPRIAVVGRPVLVSAVVAGFTGDMFRLVEYRRSVFVSERFAEVFRQGAFSGAELSPVAVV